MVVCVNELKLIGLVSVSFSVEIVFAKGTVSRWPLIGEHTFPQVLVTIVCSSK